MNIVEEGRLMVDVPAGLTVIWPQHDQCASSLVLQSNDRIDISFCIMKDGSIRIMDYSVDRRWRFSDGIKKVQKHYSDDHSIICSSP